MVFVCAVRNCVNSKRKTKQSDCQLHRFPKDISLCNQWLKNCKLYDLCGQSEDNIYKSYRICSKHFVASSYCNPEKTRLLPTAIPTEFDYTEEKIGQPLLDGVLDDTEQKIYQPLLDGVEVPNEDNISLGEPRYSSTPSKSNISDTSTRMASSMSSSTSVCTTLSTSNTQTQTTQLLSVNTPRKRQLKTKVNELEKKCRILEENVSLISNKFSHFHILLSAPRKHRKLDILFHL